jgi:hypothetical protein
MGLRPVALKEPCPSPGSLLIPDDLDSRRCQQPRSEDFEHLQVAAESSNRLLGERVARAVRIPGQGGRESEFIPVSSPKMMPVTIGDDAGH